MKPADLEEMAVLLQKLDDATYTHRLGAAQNPTADGLAAALASASVYLKALRWEAEHE